jgi:hypothetical protein
VPTVVPGEALKGRRGRFYKDGLPLRVAAHEWSQGIAAAAIVGADLHHDCLTRDVSLDQLP